MTNVFVDPGVLAGYAATGAAPGELQLGDGAAAAVRHLVDAGHRIVLLGEGPAARRTATAIGADPEDVVPAVPDAERGWLVTADPAASHDARRNMRLRTVLVGPTTVGQGLAHKPADVEARDLIDAVLVILTADAMPDARP